MRRSPVLAAAAVMSLLSAAGAVCGQDLTEQDLLRRVDRSRAAESLRLRIDEVRAEAALRIVLPNPLVAYSREDAAGTRDEFVLFRQELPLFGPRGFFRQAGEARVRATEAQADAAVRRLRLDARLVFTTLLVAQEREAALRQGITDLEELVRILRSREREGDSSRFDRVRAERELADLRADLVAEQITAAQARAALQPFLADAPAPITVAKGTIGVGDPAPLANLLQRALQQRADYRAAVAAVEAQEFEVRAVRRQRVPQPVIVAGTKRTEIGTGGATGYTLGLEARVPLFDRGAANVALADAARRRVELERDVIQARIAAELRAAHDTATLARAQAEQFQAEVAASGAELARIARVAYEAGEQGILELLDAYRTAVNARVRALDLRGRARRASVELDFVSGEEVIR